MTRSVIRTRVECWLVIVGLLTTLGCQTQYVGASRDSRVTQAEAEQSRAICREFLEALRERNRDRLLSCVHPDSPWRIVESLREGNIRTAFNGVAHEAYPDVETLVLEPGQHELSEDQLLEIFDINVPGKYDDAEAPLARWRSSMVFWQYQELDAQGEGRVVSTPRVIVVKDNGRWWVVSVPEKYHRNYPW